jgi:hypothetical protein
LKCDQVDIAAQTSRRLEEQGGQSQDADPPGDVRIRQRGCLDEPYVLYARFVLFGESLTSV